MAGDVDADFRHRLDPKWMNVASGLGAGAFDTEIFIKRGAQETFGKMGAATVASAEDEDGGWFHGRC
jgi:hypothetical protein